MTAYADRKLFIAAWFRTVGWGVGLYLVLYAAAMHAVLSMSAGLERTALILLPIAPGIYIIASTIRITRRCDEYIRLRVLQAVGVTAAVTAIWTLAYAYLELLGLPHLSVGLVHAVGWPVFIVQMVRLMRADA